MRNKDLFAESKEIVGSSASNYVLLSLTKQGIIIRDTSEGKGKFPKDFNTYKVVKPNQMVFCLFDVDETPRTVGLSSYDGMITGAYNVFNIRRALPQYLLYYYTNIDDRKALKPLYKGLRKVVPLPAFMSAKVCLPPLAEQQAIVDFLKVKTDKIDQYVAQRERERELLDSLKQSEIAKAVTQGLNPDVPMKDSGIPWIGMIPEHWEVKQLSRMAKEHYISNKEIHHQNLLSLSYGRIIKKDINTTTGLLPASYDTYQIVEEGNIVLRLTDLQNDHKSLRVGLCTQEGIVTSAYLALETRNNILPQYLYYVLHTIDIKKVFYSMGNGLRQNLNWGELRKLLCTLPPLPEQRAIVSYIESRLQKIDSYIADLQREIDYLKEFKQRLISDAVTGQIKVTD